MRRRKLVEALSKATTGVAATDKPCMKEETAAATRSGSVLAKATASAPPIQKPTTKVGTLGPYRGRLGLAWVIAPIVVGLVIYALFGKKHSRMA